MTVQHTLDFLVLEMSTFSFKKNVKIRKLNKKGQQEVFTIFNTIKLYSLNMFLVPDSKQKGLTVADLTAPLS